jgi:hypothetical protein
MAGFAHPLARAIRTLTMRIQDLERTLPDDDAGRAAWPHWQEFTLACDAVARLIAVTTAPPEPITRRELAGRFAGKGR